MRTVTQCICRVLVLATAITVLAAPTAWAVTAEQFLSEPESTTGGADPREQANTPQTAPTPSPAAVSGDGFDWGDAGLGATAMLAVTAMAAGGTLVLRNRPRHDSVAQ